MRTQLEKTLKYLSNVYNISNEITDINSKNWEHTTTKKINYIKDNLRKIIFPWYDILEPLKENFPGIIEGKNTYIDAVLLLCDSFTELVLSIVIDLPNISNSKKDIIANLYLLESVSINLKYHFMNLKKQGGILYV